MENDNKKILTVGFVIVALLVAFSAGMLIDTFAGSWAVIARMANNDLIHHGLPILLGLIAFACLQFNVKVIQFFAYVFFYFRILVCPSLNASFALSIVFFIFLVFS